MEELVYGLMEMREVQIQSWSKRYKVQSENEMTGMFVKSDEEEKDGGEEGEGKGQNINNNKNSKIWNIQRIATSKVLLYRDVINQRHDINRTILCALQIVL